MLLELLLELQQVDTQRDSLIRERNEALKFMNDRSEQEKIEVARAKLEQFAEAVNKARLSIKRKEDAVERLKEKQQDEEKKLFSSGISAREAEVLQKDVEHLKERIEQLTSELGQDRGKLKQIEEKFESGRKLVENYRKDYEARLAGAKKRLAELEKAVAESEEKIAVLRQQISDIDAQALKIYDKLRQRYKGQVVCGVDRSSRACTGCYVELTPEVFELIVKEPDRIHICDNCGRILVVNQ